MMNLTFGEQVKIILNRKGMTIKQLAEEVEKYTGKPMSRQNMTQRLGRDNFQEQDMRLIAEILGCKFTLSIMETEVQQMAAVEVEETVEQHTTIPPKHTEGEINPYTGREYETNSVRIHPNKIGYVQVYNREQHAWAEMTEWGFLGYQERMKQALGKDYKTPIYLD